MKHTAYYHKLLFPFILFMFCITLFSCNSSRLFLHGYHSNRSNHKNIVSVKECNPDLEINISAEKKDKDSNQKTEIQDFKYETAKKEDKLNDEDSLTDFAEKNRMIKVSYYSNFQSVTDPIQNKIKISPYVKTLESDVKNPSENVKRIVNVVALTGFLISVFNIIGGFLLTALFIDSFGIFVLLIGVPILAIVGLILGIIGANQIRRNPKTQKGIVFGILSIIGNSIILVFALLFWLATLLM